MKTARSMLLKYSPFVALAGGFIGGVLVTAPIAAQERGAPAIETVQAGPIERVTPVSAEQTQLSFAPVAAQASPAVVNVYAQRVVRERLSPFADPLFRGFGGMTRERVQQSLGSGVIVRADGVIVTNHHVIEGAQALKVVLADRREYDATLLVDDPRTDLAVLQIETDGESLPSLRFANTHDAAVGDLVLAIGNPFGLQQTVTSGIISALARTEVGANDYAFYIQTDASINRGNSGGALVDMQGALVGVNTMILSESGGSVGVGFAVPSEMVRRVVETALSGGDTVVHPWLGAKVQAVTPDIARSLGLQRPEGVLVSDLYPGSSGERAGLREGDIILSINDASVFDEAGLRYQFATQSPGARVRLEVRRGQRTQTLTASAEPPPGGKPDAFELVGNHPLSGSSVVTLTPATAEEAGLDPFATGVFIQALDRRGIAVRAGFRPGDIVSAVNGERVSDAASLDRMLSGQSRWVIDMERNGQRGQISFGR